VCPKNEPKNAARHKDHDITNNYIFFFKKELFLPKKRLFEAQRTEKIVICYSDFAYGR